MPTRERARSPIPVRLRQGLKLRELSQKQLGIHAGMDPSVASVRINQYATGRHEPSFVIVSRLALVLDLPVAFFYCPEDDLATLIAAFPGFPPKTRRKLKALVSSVRPQRPRLS